MVYGLRRSCSAMGLEENVKKYFLFSVYVSIRMLVAACWIATFLLSLFLFTGRTEELDERLAILWFSWPVVIGLFNLYAFDEMDPEQRDRITTRFSSTTVLTMAMAAIVHDPSILSESLLLVPFFICGFDILFGTRWLKK